MNIRPLAFATFLAAAAAAQTPPCLSFNDANNTVSTAVYSFGFAGPNVNAWQFTPTAPQVVQSLRILTGNTGTAGPFLSLAIWDENPATSLPNAPLGSGTWKIQAANAWQGTNLDRIVVLQAATNYWIVFTDPGFSTVPTEPGGTSMLATARMSGSSWTAGAGPQALKCRLYCNQLDDAHLTPSGSACAAAGGGYGTVFANDTPAVGNANFAVEGSGFPGNTLAILAMGLNSSWPGIPIPGGAPTCMLNTDPQALLIGTTGTGNVRAATALGHVAFPLPLPANPSLAGLNVIVQILAIDPMSTFAVPLLGSNALTLGVY